VQKINIVYTDQDQLAAVQARSLSELQATALTQRLDIQRALADYSAHEAALRLEIEKQYPDLTLSPGFFFDQGDHIWSLGTSWILPLLQPRNEGPIREALAQREIMQAEFLALQARVINEISSAHGLLVAQASALREAEQLLKDARERNHQMQRQFDLGYVDQLQISRSHLEVHDVEQAVSDLEFAVIRSAGQLEDTVQFPLFTEQTYRYLFNPELQ
jgi:outer membrane protein TolC